MNLKFGKKPASPAHLVHSLKLSDFLDHAAVLPEVPAMFGRERSVDVQNMYANDKWGCCVFAGAAHETRLWSREGTGTPVTFTDDNILADYSAVTGFNLNDPSSDQGTNMGDAAKYRQTVGVVDATGKRHRVAAALLLHKGDWDQHMVAAYIFEAIGFGFEVPASINDQFAEGKPWDMVPGSPIVGGHYVAMFGRNSHGNAVASTWGGETAITRPFVEKYNDESYAYISEEMLRSGTSPRGFDMPKLQAYLASL
jgi:hypothetical protein